MVLELSNGLFGQSDVRETQTEAISKTTFLSIDKSAFKAENPDTDQIRYHTSDGYLNADADGIILSAPVTLPHGATVTAVKVLGNAGAEAETWSFLRIFLSTLDGDIIATAAINTEDITITEPVINNETFVYSLITSSIDTGDRIYGATITYTTA